MPDSPVIHTHQILHSVLSFALAAAVASVARCEDASHIEHRLSRTVHFLASDQLAGRGLGTPELDQAAEYLHEQFAQLGLEVAYQPFSFTAAAEQGPNNRAAFVDRTSHRRLGLTVDRDFRPLAIGDAGNLHAPLVFAGYGITAPDCNYDDYASVDVRDKVVVVLRHEPRQDDPNCALNGTDDSEHAPFRRKLKNAMDHGAMAVVFCTDSHEIDRMQTVWQRRHDAIERKLASERRSFAATVHPTAAEVAQHRRRLAQLNERLNRFAAEQRSNAQGLLPFEGAGLSSSDERLPVLVCSRDAIDRLLLAAGRPSLARLEASIDRDFAAQSFELVDWQLVANVDIAREETPVKNVVAVLEASGSYANETIVIGAHYDHLGRPRNRQNPGAIHNGADDNASGISLLLEMAGHYAKLSSPPPRRMVFVAFTGEERGLLGSAHYVAEPAAPLFSTVAMFNFDMVGRLSDNRLILSGSDTAAEFSHWVDEVNERHGFQLVKVPGGLGPSDHASFYAQQIPVLHFFTGMHAEYHRPSDDVELLNITGMRRVGDYARELIDMVLESPERPTYTLTDGPSKVD